MKAIVWWWRHYVLHAEAFESVDSAVENFWHKNQGDDCYAECVEDLASGVIDVHQHPVWLRLEAEYDARRSEWARLASTNPATHRIMVRHPAEEKWATVGGTRDPETALTEWGRLGANRAKVEEVGR